MNGVDDNELDEDDLKILEEKYGLKIKTGGYNSEAQSLSEVGITSINLSTDDSTTMYDDFDGNGNQLMTQNGATFTYNGEVREYADIWHRKLDDGDKGNIFAPKKFASALSFDIRKRILNMAALLGIEVNKE